VEVVSRALKFAVLRLASLVSIGSTSVNISREQATAIAMNYIENYSYEMPDGVWISDFKVASTGADLVPIVRESYVLYPCWQVSLCLDKTYSGSVHGLLVLVWADSGEVSGCSNIAYSTPS
jgi:hypothetical protein